MTITLTAKQIMAMADFAGFNVGSIDIDDNTEYTLDIEHNSEYFDKNKPIFYCTEYPEEGAIQLE